MEAARKTIEVLTKRILPERPHHLSFHTDWRYRASSADAKRFEEWYNTRLQYLTLLSEADRGVLLTRSDYDMREEPVKPLPREVNALAKGSEKKKLSLSDYKNKKTSATSTSPPEPAIAKKKESERAVDANASEPKPLSEARPATDSRKPDRSKPRESDTPADAKQRPPREPVVDMRLPPKPPAKFPLPPWPPSPNVRKRVADVDDEARPQKRSKPDTARSTDDKSQVPRDDVRRKDRIASSTSSRDAPAHRDDKPTNSSTAVSSLPNGRAILKNAVGSGRNASSPGSRSSGDSLNGVRPNLTGSNRVTPTKPDSSKTSVPPLLSPLHLTFDDRDRENGSPKKLDKKKRDESRERARSPKPKKAEAPTGTKRLRSPAKLPPLLSPTLPAVVEAALQLRKVSSLESLDGKPKDEKDPPTKKKKPPVDYSDDEDDEPLQKTQRKSHVVVLKISKKNRQMLRRILALTTSTSSRKELLPQSQERPSAEESSQPPPARKRPVATQEPVALKKPRASDIPNSSRLPAPSTPSKKGTAAMSRVSSNNSLAQTPGDTVNATPSAATSSDRRVNGQDAHRAESPEARAMRHKESSFSNLGRRLKHEADVMMGGGRRSPGANGHSREPNLNRGYVVHLESLLAFMAGFHAQNTHRGLSNKRSDPTGWASLFPLMEFLQREMRKQESNTSRFLPLYALLLLLHAAAITELVKCHAAVESPTFSVTDFIRAERSRNRIWSQIRDTNASIDNTNLRVEYSPWTTLDELTTSSIRMLRRWCADQDVDWTPDPSLREPVVPKNAAHQSQNSRG